MATGVRLTLLVTRPVWAGREDLFAEALGLAAANTCVDVVSAPLQLLHPLSAQAEQVLVQAIREEQGLKPPEGDWLVATSPASAQALGELPLLLSHLAGRQPALRLAAVGESSADALQAVMQLRPTLIADTVGDADTLAARLSSLPLQGARVFILEAADNRPQLAAALQASGYRVLRLPVYTRAPQAFPSLSRHHQDYWVLLSSSRLIGPAIEELTRQQIAPEGVTWVGHHPAIGEAVTRALPQARWVMVDRLSPSTILERMTNHPAHS
jgi:uroporphyrinogen-III synthase